jgi:hypothetical protein
LAVVDSRCRRVSFESVESVEKCFSDEAIGRI